MPTCLNTVHLERKERETLWQQLWGYISLLFGIIFFPSGFSSYFAIDLSLVFFLFLLLVIWNHISSLRRSSPNPPLFSPYFLPLLIYFSWLIKKRKKYCDTVLVFICHVIFLEYDNYFFQLIDSANHSFQLKFDGEAVVYESQLNEPLQLQLPFSELHTKSSQLSFSMVLKKKEKKKNRKNKNKKKLSVLPLSSFRWPHCDLLL